MIFKTAFMCGSVLLMLLPVRDVIAIEPLSTAELTLHCTHYAEDPEGEDAIFCVRYIQGFIDGAVATDERVTLNVAAEYDQKETFSERAMRTRGPDRLSRYGPTVYAEFCLGAPVPLKQVVKKVVHDLENRTVIHEQLLARDAVYRTLRTAYPCETDDNE